MAKYLPICGKNPSGNAKAANVSARGDLQTVRVWEQLYRTLSAGSPTTTSAIISTAFDASNYAIVSLRFDNKLDVDLDVTLLEDTTADGGSWLGDASGNAIKFTVPHNSLIMIMTPDDLPVLNYLHYLKLRIQPKTAPTSGHYQIDVMCKR